MSQPPDSIEERAQRYARSIGRKLEQPLGFGKDGIVYATDLRTAIKVFGRAEVFARERNCYFRLIERDVLDVLGHGVPQLLHVSDEYFALEMTTVEPPFLLDFASAYLDEPPDFSREVIVDWYEQKAEEFGANWPKVRRILTFLAHNLGIFLTDVHPGNITFKEDNPHDREAQT
jgi:hypothetical protein